MPAVPGAHPAIRGRPAPPPDIPTVLLRLPELDDRAPLEIAEWFRQLRGVALLDSARPGRTGRWSFLTADPVAVLDAPTPGRDPFAGARSLLGRLAGAPAAAGSEGHAVPFAGGLVGYLGYDLGRAFERVPAIADPDQDLPILRLALHDWAIAWERKTGRAWLGGRALDGDVDRLVARLREVRARVAGRRGSAAALRLRRGEEPPLPQLRSRTSPERWVAGVEAVRAAIARGEIYQANLTRRLEAPFRDDPWPLFRRLRTGDPALFAGYLDLGPSPATGARRALLSASPEPFLAVDAEGRVATDPIKGTRPRGRTRDEDRTLARELLASGKDQAENVMIVDVLRNDLGRVCVPGSVRVPRLCRLERTAAVQHLVTTVTGRLRPGLDPFHLLAASFPGGSITGAPKIRAMQLLESLEPVRRGPYSGAMLWVGPDGRMGSSILIRTFVADGERLTLHVGGGITWRSDPHDEWEETVAKARGPLTSIGTGEATE